MATEECITDVWTGCYPSSWQGICVSPAFAHPAKFARGLIQRIVQHLQKEGWLHAGDVCLDPFGGVGLGGHDLGLAGGPVAGGRTRSAFLCPVPWL